MICQYNFDITLCYSNLKNQHTTFKIRNPHRQRPIYEVMCRKSAETPAERFILMDKFKFAKIAIILIVLLLHTNVAIGAEILYVFFPSVMSATSIQKKLSKAWTGIEIMVFGRFRDFEDRVSKDVPDAVLAKLPVIERIGGYAIALRGSRGESTEESYVFLTLDKQNDVNHLSGKSVGVIDILGRKGMNMFVGKFLNPAPKLRRVSKVDDLLQMLTFKIVAGILTPNIYVSYYKKISNLDFVITPMPNMKTGILALGVKQGKEAPLILAALGDSEKQYMELLEVEQWK